MVDLRVRYMTTSVTGKYSTVTFVSAYGPPRLVRTLTS